MGRVVAIVIGVALIGIGVVAFVGAVEVIRAGAETGVIAQSALVPATLFVIGVFLIWMGIGGRRR